MVVGQGSKPRALELREFTVFMHLRKATGQLLGRTCITSSVSSLRTHPIFAVPFLTLAHRLKDSSTPPSTNLEHLALE